MAATLTASARALGFVPARTASAPRRVARAGGSPGAGRAATGGSRGAAPVAAAAGGAGAGAAGSGSNDRTSAALRQAQEAVRKADAALADIPTLPGATWESFAKLQAAEQRAAKSSGPMAALLLLLLGAVMLAGEAAALPYRALAALAVAAAVGARGYSRRSLDASGGLAAAVVGAAMLFAGLRFGAILLAFYFLSSAITKLGAEYKMKIEDEVKAAGERNAAQVFANAGAPAILSLLAASLVGFRYVPLASAAAAPGGAAACALAAGALGYLACCCGDTWASELGKLSPEEPRLITSLRKVRPGTNGAVTVLGTLASAAGGAFMGAVFLAASLAAGPLAAGQWRVVPLGAAAGAAGSVIDSLLGATLQFTGFCSAKQKVVGRPGPTVSRISGLNFLSNGAVNLCSALLTSAAVAWLSLRMF